MKTEFIGNNNNSGEKRPIQLKKGFTLIELVIVLAVLGILTTIAVPQFVGFEEKAELTALTTEINTRLAEADAQTKLRSDLDWSDGGNPANGGDRDCANVVNGVTWTKSNFEPFEGLDDAGLKDIPSLADAGYSTAGAKETRSAAEAVSNVGAYFIIPAGATNAMGQTAYCPINK